MDKLEEMGKFLEKYNLPKLNQGEIEIMNNRNKHWSWSCDQKSPQKTKAQDQIASQENSVKHLKKS